MPRKRPSPQRNSAPKIVEPKRRRPRWWPYQYNLNERSGGGTAAVVKTGTSIVHPCLRSNPGNATLIRSNHGEMVISFDSFETAAFLCGEEPQHALEIAFLERDRSLDPEIGDARHFLQADRID